MQPDFLSRRCLAVAASLVFGAASVDAQAAGPLPTGGAFVAGTGSISTGAQSVTIGQTSTRGVIEWNSFDIGAGRTVTIDNGTGATLNRVTGGVSSSILGALNSTGSVYLINPQGVVIGTSGVVATGGRFVASALDLSNADFMSAGAQTFAKGGNGTVVNLGKIGSSGGDVFLIARSTVSNQGTITAPKGTAEMAVGSQVLLKDSTSGQQVFVQAGSGGTVSNAGAIDAVQVNLQAADGNVYALAGNTSAIRATGTATREGHVWLVADRGHVQIHDSVSATGGTVDSSGTTLNIGGSTVSAEQWNFAVPVSYTIDQTTANALSASLNKGTSVDFEAKGNASSIALNGGIGWNSAATLTLEAGKNIGIAKTGSIGNTNSGDLVLRADAGSIDNGGSVVNLGKIDWSKSTGIVSALYDMNGSYVPGTLLSNRQWTAAPYSGEITQITAYRLVNNATDLQNVGKDVSANYALGKDIDASTASAPYFPIGGEFNHYFVGQFDGFGHTIANLTVGTVLWPAEDGWGGLFGVVGAAGAVRNIALVNATGKTAETEIQLGLLVGRNDGTVANASSSGTVTISGSGGPAAGLVGINNGIVERSSSSASLSSESAMGGLVNINFGFIVQSYATGSLTGGTISVGGGLAAQNFHSIVQSYATGKVGSTLGAGGLVGDNEASATIGESFATGKVGGGGGGAIVSFNDGVIGPDVHWDKTLTSRSYASAHNRGSNVGDINGLTTAQMSDASNFKGWDFTGTWAMPPGATHPVFQWQTTQQ